MTSIIYVSDILVVANVVVVRLDILVFSRETNLRIAIQIIRKNFLKRNTLLDEKNKKTIIDWSRSYEMQKLYEYHYIYLSSLSNQ